MPHCACLRALRMAPCWASRRTPRGDSGATFCSTPTNNGENGPDEPEPQFHILRPPSVQPPSGRNPNLELEAPKAVQVKGSSHQSIFFNFRHTGKSQALATSQRGNVSSWKVGRNHTDIPLHHMPSFAPLLITVCQVGNTRHTHVTHVTHVNCRITFRRTLTTLTTLTRNRCQVVQYA